MFKYQVFLIFVGILLAGLGLFISLGAAFSGIPSSDGQSTLSPLDQSDDVILPEEGFAPLIIPTIRVHTIDEEEQEHAILQPLTGQDLAASIFLLTGTPTPVWRPSRLIIPSIELDAPVVPAEIGAISYLGKTYSQLKAPGSFAAGWAPASGSLGIVNNTVLFGHHNTNGEVFAHLVDLQVDDLIVVYSGKRKFAYVVALKLILLERNQPVDARLQNARWILPSADERLTLLTCWPYTSNTHRLIIVAVPISLKDVKDYPLIPRLTPQAP